MFTHFEAEVLFTPLACHFLRWEQPTFLYSLNSRTTLIFYLSGGVQQLLEAVDDQKVKDCDESMLVICLGEIAVPIDELEREKLFFGHHNGTGVPRNYNMTCMLKKSRLAPWTFCLCFLGKIQNASNQN